MSDISDLKVYRCICRTPCKITAHRDGMYILNCPRCGTEYAFPDDHSYFTHEDARMQVGDYVIYEAFVKRG